MRICEVQGCKGVKIGPEVQIRGLAPLVGEIH